jgi:hypothetical protein
MGFFTKIGGALKSFADDPGGYIKQGAIKYAPMVEKASGLLRHMPGAIGLISTAVHHGTKAARESLEGVQNEKVKEKLTNELNKSSAGSVTVSPKGEIVNESHPNTNKDFMAKHALNTAGEFISSLHPRAGPRASHFLKSMYKSRKKRKK